MLDLGTQLSNELAELVNDISAPVSVVTRITTNPSSDSQRASFRLDFADGRTLKGRHLQSPEQAERLQEISNLLHDMPFVSVVSRRGSAVLEEWAEGSPLSQHPPSLRIIRQAGELLGELSTVEGDIDFGPRIRDGRLRLDKLRDQYEKLLAYSALDRDTCKRLLVIARANCPHRLAAGLVHLDYSAENLIVDGHKHIHVIDNESMDFTPYDTDLGRTWYLWPMQHDEWTSFIGGYEKYRSVEMFLEHIRFWAIFVLTGALLYRLENGCPIKNLDKRLIALTDGAPPRLWAAMDAEETP